MKIESRADPSIQDRIQIGPIESRAGPRPLGSLGIPPTPPPQEFRLKPYVRAALTTWASAAALRSAIVMWGPEWDPTECMDPRGVPVEPSGIKGYFAMSVVDAAKVRRLEVLWSNSASITFKNKAPTPFIFFHDEPLDALEAAELAVGSPGNNEWMVLEVKFTPFQVFKLFVSHRICRTKKDGAFPKYGFRVYHADAADADAGRLDLTEHGRMWLKTVDMAPEPISTGGMALVDAGAKWGRSPDRASSPGSRSSSPPSRCGSEFGWRHLLRRDHPLYRSPPSRSRSPRPAGTASHHDSGNAREQAALSGGDSLLDRERWLSGAATPGSSVSSPASAAPAPAAAAASMETIPLLHRPSS